MRDQCTISRHFARSRFRVLSIENVDRTSYARARLFLSGRMPGHARTCSRARGCYIITSRFREQKSSGASLEPLKPAPISLTRKARLGDRTGEGPCNAQGLPLRSKARGNAMAKKMPKRLPHTKDRWSSNGLSDGVVLAEMPVMRDYVRPASVKDWCDTEHGKTCASLSLAKKAKDEENRFLPDSPKAKVIGEGKDSVDTSGPMPEGKVRTKLRVVPDSVRYGDATFSARWTKTDAKVSEYVWRDLGNGPELVRRDKLELEALALVVPERTPLVQRTPRKDGKKVFADYRKERKPVLVTDKAGVRKA